MKNYEKQMKNYEKQMKSYEKLKNYNFYFWSVFTFPKTVSQIFTFSSSPPPPTHTSKKGRSSINDSNAQIRTWSPHFQSAPLTTLVPTCISRARSGPDNKGAKESKTNNNLSAVYSK